MKGATAIVATVTAAGIPSVAIEVDVLWTIVVPIVAGWFGLVGIGVLEGKSAAQIARQVVGGICLGGVVGIASWSVIEFMQAEGIFAALVTLTLAISPVLVWKTLGAAGPDLLGTVLGAFGFERKSKDGET